MISSTEEITLAMIPEWLHPSDFYSKLDKTILDVYIKEIQKPDVRRSIINKKSVPIDKLFNLKEDEKVRPGTYQRFIIVATNIAEASITIDTLKYVIDTGEQKVNIYDPSKDLASLQVKSIAIPNQKQRKGRVGRTQPGEVYYLYDRKQLESKVLFKITIENITGMLLDMLSSVNNKIINEETDPYKTTNLKLIPEFLQQQYSYLNSSLTPVLYSNSKLLKKYDIIYPFADGKYSMETLEDKSGSFYIVHPNELDFNRNDELKIVSFRENYLNKAEKIFLLSRTKNYINSNNKLTPYGKLVTNLSTLFISEDDENPIVDIKISTLFLDMFAFGYNSVDSELFKMSILFVIFKQNIFRFNLIKIYGKADFLIKSSIISPYLYTAIDIDKIILKLHRDFTQDDITRIIERELIKIRNNTEILLDNNIFKILLNYYKYKILFKLILGTEKTYPDLFKNKLLKNININDNLKYSSKFTSIIKRIDVYNMMCLLIVKNFPYNVYKKVIGSVNLYVNYFNQDINKVYKIPTLKIYKKTYMLTNVKPELLYNTIFALDIDDSNNLTNLIWINPGIFGILKLIMTFSNIIYKNYTVDKIEIKKLYPDTYNEILEKIDKIIETYTNIN